MEEITLSARLKAIKCLHDKLSELNIAYGGAETSWNDFDDAVKLALSSSDQPERTTLAFQALVVLFREVWLHSQAATAKQLIEVCVNQTRQEPHWRTLLGLRGARNEYSILTFAAFAIGRCQGEHESCRTDLLRLIANCTFLDDSNRRDLISHGILDVLLDIALIADEVDTPSAAIWNVCAGYDEDDQNKPDASIPSDPAEPGEAAELLRTSEVGKILARSGCRYAEAASFEVFLSLAPRCTEDYREYYSGLVSLSAGPATTDMSLVMSSQHKNSWNWTYCINGQRRDTLEDANTLSDLHINCRVDIIHAVFALLSQEEARKALLARSDNPIWTLVNLVCSQTNIELPEDEWNDSSQDYEKVVADYRKQFLKVFYELTGMPEFTADFERSVGLLESSTCSLQESWSSIQDSADDPGKQCFRACCLIIIAQLAVSDQVCEYLMHMSDLNKHLERALKEKGQDILYPTITLVSRLALTNNRAELPFANATILTAMGDLLTRGGAGLAIPYETIHTFAAILRGRPQILHYFVSPRAPPSSQLPNRATSNDVQVGSSIVDVVVQTFDRSIEAGTKREAGVFFTELLRTTFPITKDIDSTTPNVHDLTLEGSTATMLPPNESDRTEPEPNTKQSSPSILNAFREVLSSTSTVLKIAEILAWTCTSAEPASSRIHGWFALGILSLYKAGRIAILQHLDNDSSSTADHGFSQALTSIASDVNQPSSSSPSSSIVQQSSVMAKQNPAQNNARMMLVNLAKVFDSEDSDHDGNGNAEKLVLKEETRTLLQNVAERLGLELKF